MKHSEWQNQWRAVFERCLGSPCIADNMASPPQLCTAEHGVNAGHASPGKDYCTRHLVLHLAFNSFVRQPK